MITVVSRPNYNLIKQAWDSVPFVPMGGSLNVGTAAEIAYDFPPPIHRWYCQIRKNVQFGYKIFAEIGYDMHSYYKNKGILKAEREETDRRFKNKMVEMNKFIKGKLSENDTEFNIDSKYSIITLINDDSIYLTLDMKDRKRLSETDLKKDLEHATKVLEFSFNIPYIVLDMDIPNILITLFPSFGKPTEGTKSFQISDDTDDIPGFMGNLKEALGDAMGELFGGSTKGLKKQFMPKIPKASFDELGGYQKVKGEMQTIIYCIKNPETLKKEGGHLPKGIILYGPPGTGKTTTVKAVAHESGVPFIDIDASNIKSSLYGRSEKMIGYVFDLANNEAKTKGACIIGLDEIDSLASVRYNLPGAVNISSLILKRMDGTIPTENGVILFGTTNRLPHVDQAFLRPGRFERLIYMGPPDEAALVEIWKIHLRNKNIQEIDYEELAKKSYKKEFTGADVFGASRKIVMDRLNMLRIGEVKELKSITTEDLLNVINDITKEKEDLKKNGTRHKDMYT